MHKGWCVGMIRLMKIHELDEVLEFVSVDERENLREILPHLNVYVYDDEGIKGFTYIVDGYIIGDILVSNVDAKPIIVEGFLSHLKARYDELIIHLDMDDMIVKPILETAGFVFEENVVDESNGVEYAAFAYLAPDAF